ncbi:MAG: PorP/SprF family type IX secretion system membrane protein [Bacteroidales bacterium]
MNFKFNMPVVERILFTIVFVSTFCILKGQQTPLSPISYWVFTPYIYNPAIVGSKDFLSIGLNAAFQGKSNTQLFSGNARISKTKAGYFSSPDILEFKNIGIGGSIYKDINGLSQNIGISGAFSYQIPLNTANLSFLSFGVSVKGVYNTLDNDSVGPAHSFKKTIFPDFDLGIYYYGTNFFTGLSATNILGNPWKSDSLEIFKIPVSRQYFFTAGYKILISKSLNIVLEPSVLIIVNDSTIRKISDNINPLIKLYLEGFCLGVSYQNDSKISFLIQFRYPRFYVGAYYELPEKTPYFKKSPIVELTVGMNIQSDKSRLSNHKHW